LLGFSEFNFFIVDIGVILEIPGAAAPPSEYYCNAGADCNLTFARWRSDYYLKTFRYYFTNSGG